MILYHGSPYKFDSFKCPLETGNLRHCERHRKKNLDVVFLTPRISYAKIYAGQHGYIYVCRVNKPIPYGDPRVPTYIARPEDVEIIMRVKASQIK